MDSVAYALGGTHPFIRKVLHLLNFTDHIYMGQYILKLLECSHQDKAILPLKRVYLMHLSIVFQTSIQDLVKGIVSECTAHFSEEGLCTDALPLEESRFFPSISEYFDCVDDLALYERSKNAITLRVKKLESMYDSVVRTSCRSFQVR